MQSKLTCDERIHAPSAGAVATLARGGSRSVRLAVLVFLTVAMAALAACSGSGGDNGASPPREDVTPVGLAFTYPFNGQQDVVLDTQLVVNFTDDVSGVSDDSLRLVPSDNDNADTMTVTVQQDDNQPGILRLIPDTNLAPNTSYRVVANDSISGGNTAFSKGDTLFAFTTRPIEGRPVDGPLKVVDVSPGDTNPVTGEQALFIQFNALRVRFSEPVDPATVSQGDSFTFVGPDGAQVPGRLTVQGRYLTFDPSNDLTPGNYTVKLTSDITSKFDKSLVAYSATRTVLSAGDTADENIRVTPTAQTVSALPDNILNGRAVNNVNISSQLIGSNDQPAQNAASRDGVRTTLAQPGLPGFGDVFPAVIRGGQKTQLTGLSLSLNGDIPTPIQSGPIDVNFANDVNVYIMANDYRNIEAPAAVRLRFDLAIGTLIDAASGTPKNVIQALSNGVFNQTVLNIQAAGLAIPQKNGDLAISTIGTFPINVNGTGNATVNLALTFVLPAGDQPNTRDDVAAPYLTAQSPSACLYAFGTPAYGAIFADQGAAPTALPEQICTDGDPSNDDSSVINSFPIESSPALIFSEPIDPASINNQSIQLSSDAGDVPATFRADGTSIVIDPVDLLQPGTTYQIMLNTSAQLTDLAGNAVTFDNPLGPRQAVGFTTEPLVQSSVQAPVLLGTLTPGVPCALTGGDFQSGGDNAGHCVGDQADTPDDFPVFQNPANVTPEAIFSQFVDSDSIVLADGCLTAGSGSANTVANATVAVQQMNGEGQCVGTVAGSIALANHGDPRTQAFAFRPVDEFVPGTRYWIVVCGTDGSSCANTIVGADTGQPLNTDPLTGTGSTPAPGNGNVAAQGGPDIVMPFDAIEPTRDFYASQFTLPHADTNGNGQFDDPNGDGAFTDDGSEERPQPGNRSLVRLELLGTQISNANRDDGLYPAYLSLARPIAIRNTLDDCSATAQIVDDDGNSAIGTTPDQCIQVSLLPGGFTALTGIGISTNEVLPVLSGAVTTPLQDAVTAGTPLGDIPVLGPALSGTFTTAADALTGISSTVGGILGNLVPINGDPFNTGRVILRFPNQDNDGEDGGTQSGYIVPECQGSLNGADYDFAPCFAASLNLVANGPDGQGVALDQQSLTVNVVGPVTFEQNGRLVISLSNTNTFALSASALGLLPATATIAPGALNFQLVGSAVHGGRAFPNR